MWPRHFLVTLAAFALLFSGCLGASDPGPAPPPAPTDGPDAPAGNETANGSAPPAPAPDNNTIDNQTDPQERDRAPVETSYDLYMVPSQVQNLTFEVPADASALYVQNSGVVGPGSSFTIADVNGSAFVVHAAEVAPLIHDKETLLEVTAPPPGAWYVVANAAGGIAGQLIIAY